MIRGEHSMAICVHVKELSGTTKRYEDQTPKERL